MQSQRDGRILSLQVNVICVLLFFAAVTLITKHPAWFH
jgi:hypothetical protein